MIARLEYEPHFSAHAHPRQMSDALLFSRSYCQGFIYIVFSEGLRFFHLLKSVVSRITCLRNQSHMHLKRKIIVVLFTLLMIMFNIIICFYIEGNSVPSTNWLNPNKFHAWHQRSLNGRQECATVRVYRMDTNSIW